MGWGRIEPPGPLDAGVSAGGAPPSASGTVLVALTGCLSLLRPPSGVSQRMFSLLAHSSATAEEAPESPSEGAIPMKRSRIVVVAATGAICALGGAAAGIAESSASSSSSPRARAPFHAGIAKASTMVFGIGPLKDAAGPPVHSESVVPNDKGGFDTI